MDFYVVSRLLMVTKALLCSHYSLLGVSSALLHGSKMFWVVSRVFYSMCFNWLLGCPGWLLASSRWLPDCLWLLSHY